MPCSCFLRHPELHQKVLEISGGKLASQAACPKNIEENLLKSQNITIAQNRVKEDKEGATPLQNGGRENLPAFN